MTSPEGRCEVRQAHYLMFATLEFMRQSPFANNWAFIDPCVPGLCPSVPIPTLCGGVLWPRIIFCMVFELLPTQLPSQGGNSGLAELCGSSGKLDIAQRWPWRQERCPWPLWARAGSWNVRLLSLGPEVDFMTSPKGLRFSYQAAPRV